MPDKIKNARICVLINAWMYLVGGIICTLIFLAFALGIGLGGGEGAEIGAAIATTFGVIFGIMLFAISGLNFYTAKGIKEKKKWSKIVAIILAVMQVFNFPVGTTLGVLILMGMLDKTADEWFI